MFRRFTMVVLPLVAGSAVLPAPAAGQDGVLETAVDELGTAAGDVLHIWSWPLRMEVMDLPVIFGLGEVTVGVGAFDDDVQNWIREHPNSLPIRILGPARKPKPLSQIGLSSRIFPITGAFWLAGLAFDAETMREAALGCATADFSNTVARHVLARLIGRRRPQSGMGPYVIKPLALGDWELRSFPGGHAANIMSCTSFWTHRYDLGVAEPLLYAVATVVGLARIPDGGHWLSDTVFGFAFGWFIGREVADRYHDREREDAEGMDARTRRSSPPLYLSWRIPFP